MTHLEEQTWNTETILNTVSFAPLILPSGSTVDDMKAIAISNRETERETETERERQTDREREEGGRKKEKITAKISLPKSFSSLQILQFHHLRIIVDWPFSLHFKERDTHSYPLYQYPLTFRTSCRSGGAGTRTRRTLRNSVLLTRPR